MLRSAPPIASWILNQFGSLPENESATLIAIPTAPALLMIGGCPN
jgi:hypothetical protein